MSDDRDNEGKTSDGSGECGYKRPPVHARFPKGQSGNPKGRPKKSRNLSTLLANALDERVIVTENGRRRSRTKREVIVTQLTNQSATGDLKAIKILWDLAAPFDAAADTEAKILGHSQADDEVVRGLIERLRKQQDE